MAKNLLAPIIGLALVAVAWPPPTAQAQQIEDGTITVIQPKPTLRRHRLQLTPRMGSTINDALLRQFAVGATLAYNPSERISVGGTFEWMDFDNQLGGTTQAYEEVIDTTGAIPELAPLNWWAGVDVAFLPLYGKLVLFNKTIGYFDLYVSGGIGVVDSQRDPHVGGSVAAGVNLYFNSWLGLNTEFRDRMTREELGSGSHSFTNTVTASVGFTFLLGRAEYTYDDEEAGQ